MNDHSISIAAGAVIRNGSKILLVQITYGPNKGFWMLPGGYLEAGESLEEAAAREVKEETGLDSTPGRIIAIRDGVRFRNDSLETNLYIIFEMTITGGNLEADGSEISNIAYWDIDEIIQANDVVSLTKQIIKSGLHSPGFSKQNSSIETNTAYRSYALYV